MLRNKSPQYFSTKLKASPHRFQRHTKSSKHSTSSSKRLKIHTTCFKQSIELRNFASPYTSQSLYLSTIFPREIPPLIPDIDPQSSFFHRGVKALFDTTDLKVKLALISDSRRLLRKQSIPLINWPQDQDIFNYFHFGTTNPTSTYPSISLLGSIKPPTLPKYQPKSKTSLQTTNHEPMQPPNLDDVNHHLWGDLIKTSNNSWVLPARPEFPTMQYRVPSAKDLAIPVNAHILHTLAHIELNAVEMYLDTVLRFGIFPPNPPNQDSLQQLQTSPPQPSPSTQSTFPRPIPDQLTTHPTLHDQSDPQSFSSPIQPTFGQHYKERTLIPRVGQQQPNPSLQYLDERYPIYDDGYNVIHPDFIDDMLTIVSDETRHFHMCCDRLEELSIENGKDYRYGTQLSTFLLWVLGSNTRYDLAERLAVIPLSQEARGLDSTTRFVDKAYSLNDHRTASILALIGKEEERHVSLGLKWFLYCAAARGVISTGYAAEYDYNHIPLIDLKEEEHYDFRGKKKKSSQNNSTNDNKTHSSGNTNLGHFRKKQKSKPIMEHFDDSAYHTDSEHIGWLRSNGSNKNDPFNWLIDETFGPNANNDNCNSANANTSHVDMETQSVLSQSTTLPTRTNDYSPQVPIHVKRLSAEIHTTEAEKLLCETNIAKYWQDNVKDHFDDGFFPPFNRLARYASGMPESWYIPLSTSFVPLNFVTVAPNAPTEAPIRKHFKRLIDKMHFDHQRHPSLLQSSLSSLSPRQ